MNRQPYDYSASTYQPYAAPQQQQPYAPRETRIDSTDGTSMSNPGAPVFRIRATTTEMPPAQVKDMILSKISDAISDYLGVNMVAATIVGIIAAVIYIISILMALTKIVPMAPPAMIERMALWRYLSAWPLTVWLIIAPLAASLVDVAKWHKTGLPWSVYLMLAVGVLTLVYVIRTWSSCRRYLLLIAAVYGIVVPIIRMGLMGFQSIAQNSVAFLLVEWFYLLNVVLGIIDLFIVVPQCRRV